MPECSASVHLSVSRLLLAVSNCKPLLQPSFASCRMAWGSTLHNVQQPMTCVVLGVLLGCIAVVKSHLSSARGFLGQPHPLSKHTAVAAVFLCTLQDGSGAALNNLQQPVANLVISIMCWVSLTANLCQIFFRVWRAHKLKKVWKRRRLVTCNLSILELIVQWVSQTSCSPPDLSVPADIGGLTVQYIDR